MAELPWLPELPDWVPYPLVVWFVVEGIVLGLVGILIRDYLSTVVPGALIAGNIVFFVGSITAILGGVAYVVLLALNR